MLDTMDVEYKINYVRVYQNKNDPTQKVGCSTPERPTRQWIEGHKDLYMQKTDDQPLKSIQRGGGACIIGAKHTNSTCGGAKRGTCKPSKKGQAVCQCNGNWTGPNCLVPISFDDILWDPPSKLEELGFILPSAPMLLVSFLTVIIVGVVMSTVFKKRLDGFTPIPEVAGKGDRLKYFG